MANIAKATTYADAVSAAASRYGLAPALLAGLVDHESAWNPQAYRLEAKINDASRGLGQLLYQTAQSLGYSGDPDGLFDPDTNLDLTARYLAQQIAQAGGSIEGGLSAYNGGWRPAQGFGQPYGGPNPYVVVLARDADGNAVTTRMVNPGEYANQPYVDAVMTAARTFATSSVFNPQAPDTGGSSPAPLALVLDPISRVAPDVPTWVKVGFIVGAVGYGVYQLFGKSLGLK